MADVKGLLIPGTGATALRTTLGQNIGNPARPDTAFALGSLAFASPQEAVDTLAMEHRPGQWAPLRTSLVAGRSILPNHAFAPQYLNVPDDYAHFLYDWRCDIRHNAERLVRWLETRTREGERWHVVAHSQGVLVAIVAAKMMECEDTFARYVASLRMVGPPVAGTVEAARWMIDGLSPTDDGSFVDRVIDRAQDVLPGRANTDEPSNLQEAVRTWPSLYQMLPVWDAVTDPDGEPLRDFRLLEETVWEGHDAIDADLLRRGRELREWLSDPLSHLVGVDARFVLTSHKPTPVGMAYRDGRLTSEVTVDELGDGLIPFEHTLSPFGPRVRRLADEAEKANRLHDKLLSDDGVWRFAKLPEV